MEPRMRSRCPLGMWERDGWPSCWKEPSGLSPGNMSQGSSYLCLGPSALGRIRPFRTLSVLGGPGSGFWTNLQSLCQAAGPSGQRALWGWRGGSGTCPEQKQQHLW